MFLVSHSKVFLCMSGFTPVPPSEGLNVGVWGKLLVVLIILEEGLKMVLSHT